MDCLHFTLSFLSAQGKVKGADHSGFSVLPPSSQQTPANTCAHAYTCTHIHSPSLQNSYPPTPTHKSTLTLTCLFMPLILMYPHTQSPAHSCTHTLTHSNTHSHTPHCAHSSTFTHPHNHTYTCSLTCANTLLNKHTHIQASLLEGRPEVYGIFQRQVVEHACCSDPRWLQTN